VFVKMEPQRSARLLELEDYLLLTPVLLLPWAFGGVGIWAYRSAALLLVGAACVSLWKRGWLGWGIRRGSGWLLPAFLLAAWAGVQLVPLPPAAIRLLSPEAHRLYTKAFPAYGGAPVADPVTALEEQALERVEEAQRWPLPAGPGHDVRLEAPGCFDQQWRTLSVEPSATQERLAWYVALLLGFLVLRERVAQRERFRAYRWAIFGLFGALALFSLVQLQLWNGKIYWFWRVLAQAKPFGPYVNPTNLAGVMELAVPALAGFIWSRLRRNGRASVYEAGFGVAAVAAACCLVAGFAAASKLAAVLIVAGLAALGLLAARTMRARLTVVALLAVLAGAGALVLGGTRLGGRLEMFLGRGQDATLLEGRVVAWQSGIEMFRDFPLTGTGFGSFDGIFARYLPAGAAKHWNHAHNDYIELLLDGGLVAAVLVVWLLVGYVRRVTGSLRREGRVSPSRIGLIVGVASLAAHAFFDFNHQIPANALLWVACCALLVSGSQRRRERGTT
jgi:O-antigen ligase